jgi:predicted nucleic acid-binding protein
MFLFNLLVPNEARKALYTTLCTKQYEMRRMIVYDSMVLIHLAKLNLLEEAVAFYKKGLIPPAVNEEVVLAGKKAGYADALEVEREIKAGKIKIQSPNKALVLAMGKLGLRGGEGESAALARELGLLLATDDDSVRSRKTAIKIELVGTLAIIVKMANEGKIEKIRALNAFSALRKIGWFSSAVIDKARMVVENV